MEFKEKININGFPIMINDDINPYIFFYKHQLYPNTYMDATETTIFYICGKGHTIRVQINNNSYKRQDIIDNYSREDLIKFVISNLPLPKRKRYVRSIECCNYNVLETQFSDIPMDYVEISNKVKINNILENILFDVNPAKSILDRIKKS